MAPRSVGAASSIQPGIDTACCGDRVACGNDFSDGVAECKCSTAVQVGGVNKIRGGIARASGVEHSHPIGVPRNHRSQKLIVQSLGSAFIAQGLQLRCKRWQNPVNRYPPVGGEPKRALDRLGVGRVDVEKLGVQLPPHVRGDFTVERRGARKPRSPRR